MGDRRPGFWSWQGSTATVALLRIAVGLLLVAWTASLAADATTFLSTAGVDPDGLASSSGWPAAAWPTSPAGTRVAVLALGVAAIAVAVGWRTRAATVTAVLLLTAAHARNPMLFNGGDALLRVLLVYLALSPAGEAVSVDNLRRGRPAWSTPVRPLWSMRLVQLQVSLVYLSTALWKLVGDGWLDGTAMWYVWHLDELQRTSLAGLAGAVPALPRLATATTLATELAIGVLVWSRHLRAPVLAFGVVLHLVIDLTMVVGFFSWAMLAAYLAFVPPEVSERLLHGLRRRMPPRAERHPHRSASGPDPHGGD